MSPQQTIAHYRIVSKLGEGGMGAVYRATDTKLNRDVAIKVLPDAFAQDSARMARFEREAQVLASLNHPNIAAIYGIEQNAIVMELVDGTDLSGPVPIDTAIDYARQIAAGLEAAHEKGIVHRDLKPANIKVTPDGVVKLLDFGLAKAVEASPSSGATLSPTLSLAMTQAGMILGTAAYMSPEQARGKPVDKRADIWAFGVVLFEMMTGSQLFAAGETVTDIIAAVVTREPDWTRLPKETPSHILRLLRRCLCKDPKLRLRDIGEARVALDETPAAEPGAAPPAPTRTHLPYLAAAVCAIAALGAAAGWWYAARPVEHALLNVSVDLGPDAVAGARISFAISPDGSRMAYLQGPSEGQASLAVRELDQPKGSILAGTVGASEPFFSPDGQWIGFFANRKLMKVPVTGGAPVPLCEAPNPRGGSWGEDGRIFFAPGSNAGISVVSENGGDPQPLTKTEPGEVTHRWPQRLPGGDSFLFSVNSVVTNWENAQVVVWSHKTRQRKTLVRGGYFGRYLPNGYLVYAREGKLFAVHFDLSRLEISGRPVALADDVKSGDQTGSGQLDISRNGMLVYLAGKGLAARYAFGWMAAGGAVEPLKGAVPANYTEPRLSPDGKQLAMLDGETVLVWDFAREAMTRLPAAGGNAWYLIWALDGRHLVYGTRGAEYDVMWRRSDGSGEPAKLLQSADPATPYAISPDGRTLLYGSGPLAHTTLWTVPIDAADADHPKAGKAEPLPGSSADETSASFSPDGRWLSYRSTESGRPEVYVRPFRGSGKVAISSGGATHAKWSRAGRQLFYLAADFHVMVVDYSVNGESFVPGKPRRWSETPVNPAGGRPCFDIALDGKHLLAFPGEAEAPAGNLHATFLINFFDEVKRRLP